MAHASDLEPLVGDEFLVGPDLHETGAPARGLLQNRDHRWDLGSRAVDPEPGRLGKEPR